MLLWHLDNDQIIDICDDQLVMGIWNPFNLLSFSMIWSDYFFHLYTFWIGFSIISDAHTNAKLIMKLAESTLTWAIIQWYNGPKTSFIWWISAVFVNVRIIRAYNLYNISTCRRQTYISISIDLTTD